MREECGVFGVHSSSTNVAHTTFLGLLALQHRGQESAGIATTDGTQIYRRAQLGLVSQVFSEANLNDLPGFAAIGHTRYSTSGASADIHNVGPFLDSKRALAVSHNGNLTNTQTLRTMLHAVGEHFSGTTDSEVLTRLIAASPGISLTEKIVSAMKQMLGAYSLVVLTPSGLTAVRDPLGIRPLCLGRLADGWVVASESCALDIVGATFERHIEPGEILHIDAHGLTSHFTNQQTDRHATCLFEYIYFSRPESILHTKRVYAIRQSMGEELAIEHPAEGADIVAAVPDSARPAALGYARKSGIPYEEALVKNKYIGRTFIQPNQESRDKNVSLKFSAVPEIVSGKRIVIVDDTIVRGTTGKPVIQLLRDAGAKEIHLRIHAPPILWPCFFGVDLASKQELIASQYSLSEIRAYLGADSLGYLSLPGLLKAINQPGNGFCTGCLTGNYPIPINT